MGCDACEHNLMAEIEAKSDDELTDSERKAKQQFEAEGSTRGVVPTLFGQPAYGPLSSWDGAHCSFCHRVGQLVALAVAITVATVAAPSEVKAAGFYVGHGWVAIGVGVGVFVPLALLVGYYGRFPVLGPVFGGVLERVAATVNIYLTEHARQAYSPDTDAAETVPVAADDETYTGGDVTVVDDPPWDDSPDAEQVRQLRRQLEKKDELLAEKRAELREMKDEVGTKDSEIDELEQQIQQIEADRDQFREQLEEEREFFDKQWFGQSRPAREQIPTILRNPEGVPIGPKYYVKTVEIHLQQPGASGPHPFAFLVDEPGQDVSFIPDTIGHNEVDEYRQYGDFYPDPDTVKNPPEFEHPAHQAYPPTRPNANPDAYPNVLFHEDPSLVREARKEKNEVTGEPQQAVLTLAYTTDGNYVPPTYDPRGFENYTEEREKNQQLQRQLSVLQHSKKQLEDRVEDLQFQLDLSEDERERLKQEQSQLRDRAETALEVAHKQSREQSALQRGLSDAHADRLEQEEQLEQLREQAHRERRRAVLGNGHDVESSITNEKAKKKAEEVYWTAWQTIRATPWEPADYDKADVDNGDMPVAEAVADFRAASSDTYDGIEDDQDLVQGILMQIEDTVAPEVGVNGGGE